MKALIALFSGIIFGVGLAVSEMNNPQKVLNFLDVTGHWDPSLLLVMLAAVIVTGIGYRIVFKAQKPLFSEQFAVPTKTAMDWRLILGVVIFGIGWGIGGYCPGPSISALALGLWSVIGFITAMVFGSWLGQKV